MLTYIYGLGRDEKHKFSNFLFKISSQVTWGALYGYRIPAVAVSIDRHFLETVEGKLPCRRRSAIVMQTAQEFRNCG